MINIQQLFNYNPPHRCFLFDISQYTSDKASPSIIKKWGNFKKSIPDGSPEDFVPDDITETNASLKEQLEAGRREGKLRAGPPAFYSWDEVSPPVRVEEGQATHVLVLMNNHPGDFNDEIASKAQGKGRKSGQISLSPEDALTWDRTGVLPDY